MKDNPKNPGGNQRHCRTRGKVEIIGKIQSTLLRQRLQKDALNLIEDVTRV